VAFTGSALATLEPASALYGPRFSNEIGLWIESLAAAAIEGRELTGEPDQKMPAILRGVVSRPIQSAALAGAGSSKRWTFAKAVLSLLGRRYPPIEVWTATRMFTASEGLAFSLTALFEVNHIERRVIVIGFPELSTG
jgi:hypothetical protein